MIFFVVITLCLFLVMAIARPVWAIALFLFFLPSYLVRYTIVGVPTTMLELLFGTLFLAWLVGMNRVRLQRIARTPFKWTILALLVFAVVSVVVSPDRQAALGLLKAYFVEPVVFFIILWERLRSEHDVRILVTAVAASACAVSVVAVLQYVHFLPSLEPWISESPHRVVGIFDYPNALGLYLAPLVGVFSAFLFLPAGRRTTVWRLFLWCTLLLSITGIFMAMSRGAMVGVLVGMFFLSLLSAYKKWVWASIVVVVLTLLIIPTSRSTLWNIATLRDVSTDVRTVLWQGTWNLLEHRPIFGSGLAGFPHYYDQYRLIKHVELPLYPHNIVLNFWVELGLGGLLAFAALFGQSFRIGVRALRAAPSFQRNVAAGALAALMIIFVHGMVDAPYFKNDLAMQFWFLVSLLVFAPRSEYSGRTR